MSIKGKVSLIKRWIGILFGKNNVAIRQGEGRFYSKNDIKGYYNDLTGKVNPNTLLDDKGIPVNIIENGEKVYFPITVFQYALGIWDLYNENDSDELKNNYLKLCQWIVDHQREDGAWDCFGPLKYKKYSVSAMGQGEAISVLIRAYVLTGETIFAEAVEKAIKFMIKPLEEGGTVLIEKEDIIFEEYPDEEGGKRSVLNGWIFSLFGIYDYLKVFVNADVHDIYQKSIITLTKRIADYETGYWSYYDRSGRIASPAYHDLHIALLNVLYDITGYSVFEQTALRWEKYKTHRINRIKAIARKARQKFKESSEGIVIQ